MNPDECQTLTAAADAVQRKADQLRADAATARRTGRKEAAATCTQKAERMEACASYLRIIASEMRRPSSQPKFATQ